jgi:hypothetical protein
MNEFKALVDSMLSTDNLYKNVAGIVFLGTPHRGVQLDQLLNYSINMYSRVGLLFKAPIMKQMKLDSDVVQTINTQFRQVLLRAPMGICSAFETRIPGLLQKLLCPDIRRDQTVV